LRVNVDRETRAVINTYYNNDGLSIRNIASNWRSPDPVAYTIKRFREIRTKKDRPQSGRPQVITKTENKSIVLLSKRDRRRTVPIIQADFNLGHDKQIFVAAIKRRLRSAYLFDRVAVRKSLLHSVNKKKQWA